MADGHRAVFREAVQAYSSRAFLWRRWVTGYGHRAQLEWRWRAHHGRTFAEWVKAGRHWLRGPGRMSAALPRPVGAERPQSHVRSVADFSISIAKRT